jgi:GH25 family lysozyme M1 (1,4-beta-N-acetylmuramidase)
MAWIFDGRKTSEGLMIIKYPPTYDVSHWKSISDFRQISPRPWLMITKATEGTTIIDTKFIPFMDGMKLIGCHRGVYHFNRKAQGAVRQADFFCNTIRSHIDDNTILILDMEEGGEKGCDVLAWFDYVRTQFPRNRVLWYTSKETLKTFVATAAERTALAKIPLWVAGYPANPDLFEVIPAAYIPCGLGAVVMWQYSAKGQITGIIGDVDLNLVTPLYQAILGEPPAPIEPPTETENIMQGTVKAFTNIRASYNKTSTDWGDLLTGDIVEWSEELAGLDGLTWLKLTKATRNGAPVLCTDGHDVVGRYAWKNNIEVSPAPVTEYTAQFDGTITLTDAAGKKFAAYVSFDLPMVAE